MDRDRPRHRRSPGRVRRQLTGLLDRSLLFVTGKGGVGKTTVASGLALLAAQLGKRTLVCEVDAKGTLADFYSFDRLAFEPREVQTNLFAMSMDTEAALKEYLTLQLRMPLMARIGPLARVFEFVATAAPGVKEVLTVGKAVYEVREKRWDLVIVDAAATGHIIGQLGAPQAINELVHVGLISQQTSWMIDILSDPARTGAIIVTTPEEMPVNETIDLAGRIQDETSVELAGVIVNRVLPELFGRGEEEVFERLRTHEDALAGATSPSVHAVLEAAELAVTLRRMRAEHLARLSDAIDAALPLLFVPYLFTKAHGLRSTRLVADALRSELT